MYITVRHGTDEKVLCNPICRVANLLSDIRSRCGVPDNLDIESLDLCDESG